MMKMVMVVVSFTHVLQFSLEVDPGLVHEAQAVDGVGQCLVT